MDSRSTFSPDSPESAASGQAVQVASNEKTKEAAGNEKTKDAEVISLSSSSGRNRRSLRNSPNQPDRISGTPAPAEPQKRKRARDSDDANDPSPKKAKLLHDTLKDTGAPGYADDPYESSVWLCERSDSNIPLIVEDEITQQFEQPRQVTTNDICAQDTILAIAAVWHGLQQAGPVFSYSFGNLSLFRHASRGTCGPRQSDGLIMPLRFAGPTTPKTGTSREHVVLVIATPISKQGSEVHLRFMYTVTTIAQSSVQSASGQTDFELDKQVIRNRAIRVVSRSGWRPNGNLKPSFNLKNETWVDVPKPILRSSNKYEYYLVLNAWAYMLDIPIGRHHNRPAGFTQQEFLRQIRRLMNLAMDGRLTLGIVRLFLQSSGYARGEADATVHYSLEPAVREAIDATRSVLMNSTIFEMILKGEGAEWPQTPPKPTARPGANPSSALNVEVVKTQPDVEIVESRRDGQVVEIQPDGKVVEIQPDVEIVETRRDGKVVETGRSAVPGPSRTANRLLQRSAGRPAETWIALFNRKMVEFNTYDQEDQKARHPVVWSYIGTEGYLQIPKHHGTRCLDDNEITSAIGTLWDALHNQGLEYAFGSPDGFQANRSLENADGFDAPVVGGPGPLIMPLIFEKRPESANETQQTAAPKKGMVRASRQASKKPSTAAAPPKKMTKAEADAKAEKEAGHFLLVVAEELPIGSHHITFSTYDSYQGVVDPADIESAARNVAQYSGWLDLESDLYGRMKARRPCLPFTQVQFRHEQTPQQRHIKVCGFHTIINAWARMLGLDIGPRRTKNDLAESEFLRQGYSMVNLALKGQMDSRTVQAFLNAYGYTLAEQDITDPRQAVVAVRFSAMNPTRLNRLVMRRLGRDPDADGYESEL